MAKVLGVVGSPRRKGNTDILVSNILDGASDAGAETEVLFLSDLNIRECDGCHACWKGNPCSKHDDMNAVFELIESSDALVFGTPVYWYGPTALMKGFIDRFVYFNCPENREKIRGKSAVLAIPFEEENPETARLLVEFFEKCFDYLDVNLAGQIIVPGVTKRGEIVDKPIHLKKGYELGRTLIQSMRE